jgi:hypothetical protein
MPKDREVTERGAKSINGRCARGPSSPSEKPAGRQPASTRMIAINNEPTIAADAS